MSNYKGAGQPGGLNLNQGLRGPSHQNGHHNPSAKGATIFWGPKGAVSATQRWRFRPQCTANIQCDVLIMLWFGATVPTPAPFTRLTLEERRGDEGVWDPKFCVPKMA